LPSDERHLAPRRYHAHEQRNAFVRHLDGVSVSELVRREASSHAGLHGRVVGHGATAAVEVRLAECECLMDAEVLRGARPV
jgi:hypothetical protein